MKKTMIALLVVVASIACVGGAEGEGEGEAATLTQIKSDIFDPRCSLAAGCHSSQGPANDLDLETDAHAALVDVGSFNDANVKLVVAGDAENSLLFQVLQDSATVGGVTVQKMPVGGSLNATDLEAVRSWIDAGAQNN